MIKNGLKKSMTLLSSCTRSPLSLFWRLWGKSQCLLSIESQWASVSCFQRSVKPLPPQKNVLMMRKKAEPSRLHELKLTVQNSPEMLNILNYLYVDWFIWQKQTLLHTHTHTGISSQHLHFSSYQTHNNMQNHTWYMTSIFVNSHWWFLTFLNIETLIK